MLKLKVIQNALKLKHLYGFVDPEFVRTDMHHTYLILTWVTTATTTGANHGLSPT